PGTAALSIARRARPESGRRPTCRSGPAGSAPRPAPPAPPCPPRTRQGSRSPGGASPQAPAAEAQRAAGAPSLPIPRRTQLTVTRGILQAGRLRAPITRHRDHSAAAVRAPFLGAQEVAVAERGRAQL